MRKLIEKVAARLRGERPTNNPAALLLRRAADEIADEVEDFKKRWPDFFKASDADDDDDDDDDDETDKEKAPDNAPAPSKGKRKPPRREDGFAKADRRFEERHPKPAS